MEDRHVIHHDLNFLLDLKNTPAHSYYAVFDGHSGVEAASYASAHLHVNMARHPEFLTNAPTAIADAYKITDENFLKWSSKENIKSGSTAVCALIREKTLYLSWLGDSQAVLVKGGKPVFVTNPHKPERPDEQKRIEDLGGHVTQMGVWRVNGVLSVTRALGDPDHKKFITNEPDLTTVELDGTEDFLILACDGLWDGMSPDDVTSALYYDLSQSSPNESLDTVAANLVHKSKLQGSEDNITAIVIFLRDINTIKEFALNLQPHSQSNYLVMNGEGKACNTDDLSSAPHIKPTVLELNAASAKKLKNAANVMSSAGFADAAYLCSYPGSDLEGMPFQNAGSDAILIPRQNVPPRLAPEATALSELPTPPIDDVLASQQFENLCSLDLCQGLNSLSQRNSAIVESKNSSFYPEDLIMGDDGPRPTGAVSSITPDEAVDIATNVVSNAIEKAVECVSSSEVCEPVTSPVANSQKLNPYAKPFVMKSFILDEQSDTQLKSDTIIDLSPDFPSRPPLEAQNSPGTKMAESNEWRKSPDECIIQGEGSFSTVQMEENQFVTDMDVFDSCSTGNLTLEFSQLTLENPEYHFKPNLDLGSSKLASQNQFPDDQNAVVQFENISYEAEQNPIPAEKVQTPITNETEQNPIPAEKVQTPIINETEQNPIPAEKVQTPIINETEQNFMADICGETVQFENLISNELGLNPFPGVCEEISLSSKTVQIPVSDSYGETLQSEHLTAGEIPSFVCDEKAYSENVMHSVTDIMDVFANSDAEMKLAESAAEIIQPNPHLGDQNINLPIDSLTGMQEHSSPGVGIPIEVQQSFLDKNALPEDKNDSNLLEDPANHSSDIPMNIMLEENILETSISLEKQESVGPGQDDSSIKKLQDEVCIDTSIQHPVVQLGEQPIQPEESIILESVTKDSLTLINITDDQKSTTAVLPTDHVDDLHIETLSAVDLQTVPDGVLEAEGVTEDADSDSEKDGGWSYMKGNTVGGAKPKPGEATHKIGKAGSLQTVSKPRDATKAPADSKSKTKNVTSVDRNKRPVTEKKMLDVKEKSKPRTLTATLPKSTVEKSPKPTSTVFKAKKEIPATAKTTAATPATKPSRPLLPARNPVPLSKSGAGSTVGRVHPTSARPTSSAATSGSISSTKTASGLVGTGNVRPKSALSTNGTKANTRPVSAPIALPKGQPSNQSTKSKITTARSTALTRPPAPAPVPSKTLTKPLSSKPAVPESKTRPPLATAATMKKPTSTLKKPDIKETKDIVNKARRNVTLGTLNKNEATKSTLNSNKPTMTLSNKNVPAKTYIARSDAVKKDVPKLPAAKLAPKTGVPSKTSRDAARGKDKKELIAKEKPAENAVVKEDGQPSAEITPVCEEEKFMLEVNDKEVIVKEQDEVVVDSDQNYPVENGISAENIKSLEETQIPAASATESLL